MTQTNQDKIIMIRIKKGARGQDRIDAEKGLSTIQNKFPNSQRTGNTVAIMGDTESVKRKIAQEKLFQKKLKLEVNVRPISSDVQEGRI